MLCKVAIYLSPNVDVLLPTAMTPIVPDTEKSGMAVEDTNTFQPVPGKELEIATACVSSVKSG